MGNKKFKIKKKKSRNRKCGIYIYLTSYYFSIFNNRFNIIFYNLRKSIATYLKFNVTLLKMLNINRT